MVFGIARLRKRFGPCGWAWLGSMPAMITTWFPGPKGLAKGEAPDDLALAQALWIDVVEMTPEEKERVERVLGADLPSRAEMQEIEASSRLYREDGAAFMTATMLIKTETQSPESTPVSFVLTRTRLITVRHAEPWSFRVFAQRAPKSGALTAEQVFIELMDTTVERLADMLELVSLELDHLSQQVFRRQLPGGKGHHHHQNLDLQKVINKIGSCGHITGKVRESLIDKNRLITFAEQAADWISPDAKARLKGVQHDIQTLSDHATFTSGKINFMLDASLGQVNINLNVEMKRMSALMIAALWPALVSGFFAMNVKLPFPQQDYMWPFYLCILLAFGPLVVGGVVWYRSTHR
jgi:magnesium transporter